MIKADMRLLEQFDAADLFVLSNISATGTHRTITCALTAGVSVLAFASTQIFEVYYFRLYLALVILGAAHGLVLLPVLLSLIGPKLSSSSQGRRANHPSRPAAPVLAYPAEF